MYDHPMYTVSLLLGQYSDSTWERVHRSGCGHEEWGRLERPLQWESDGREPDINTVCKPNRLHLTAKPITTDYTSLKGERVYTLVLGPGTVSLGIDNSKRSEAILALN